MRGTDRETGKLFSYASPESLVAARPPAACHSRTGERRTRSSVADVRADVRRGRPTIDRAGAAIACPVAAGAVHHPLGTAIDAADQLQHAVPLVRRAGDGRARLGCDGVHQESRSAAARRCRPRVPGRHPRRAAGEAAAVERAFLGGWHADRGLGFDEELPSKGRQRRASGSRPQRRT